MPIEPIGRPPLGWWKKMRPQIGRNPKYAKRSKEDKDAITAGIWQNYDDATKRKLRGRYAGKDKAVMSEKAFEYMLGFGAARGYVKDFGGWTSQNLDWERGFREGERKAEDNMRGIRTQRSREPQLERKQASLEAEFMKEKKEHPDQTAAQLWKAVAQHQYQKIPQKTILRKQGQQGPYYTDVNDPTKVEQGRERQAGLRYRAGERKEQHQKPGSVVANVIGKDDLGPLADPEKHGEPFYAGAGEDEEPSYVDVGDIVEGKGQLHPRVEDVQDHPGVSCEQAHPGEHHESWKVRNKDADAEWKLFYGHNGPRLLPMKVKRYGMFMPFETHIATKSYGFGDNAVEKGDLVVECFVSAPIKDLQGDVLDLPALMQAKEAMVRSPTNHIWLDHESPYAKPIENQRTPPIGKFVESKIMKVAGIPALWARWIVNKAHPEFKRVAYELRKGMYNAMSMEFMPHPDGQQQKMIGNKLVNVISSIKYFATSLVRAPANEAATVMRVYEKAFAEFLTVLTHPSEELGWVWTNRNTKRRKRKFAKKTCERSGTRKRTRTRT